MAERQAAHRQELEKNRIHTSSQAERRGQILAFIVALAAIVGGVYLISIDKDATGLTAIISALAALVGAFVYGKHKQAEERRQKRRPFEERRSAEQQLPLFEADTRQKA